MDEIMCNDKKTLTPRPHPRAYPHGNLEQVFDNIYLVTGTIQIKMMMCVRLSFSRNMTVIRQKSAGDDDKDDLTLVNSLRLDDEGLKALDELGSVKHVVRLGAFHGSDDAFYKERYPDATVWVVEDTPYFPAFDVDSKEIYFQADRSMNSSTTNLPVEKSSLIVIESKAPKDGILVLERTEGKVFITGDSLQNFEECDAYFNCLGRIAMRLMGFISPCQAGPAWAKVSGVAPEEMERLLQHKFDHVLPTHGRPVLGQAWKKYEPSIVGMQQKKKQTA